MRKLIFPAVAAMALTLLVVAIESNQPSYEPQCAEKALVAKDNSEALACYKPSRLKTTALPNGSMLLECYCPEDR